MIYESATKEDLQDVYNVVQHSIKTIYPKYYPAEVVDFFSEYHNREAILKDIENGAVNVLKVDGKIVATGSFAENNITRVYVLPEYQRKGYGTFIIESTEALLAEKYDKVYLEASLPAAVLYEKLGYVTVKHEKYPVENGVVLAYEIMEKKLHKASFKTYEYKRATIMKTTIREATAKDAEKIASLAVQMWKSHTVEELAQEFCEYMDKESNIIFLAISDECTVGFAQCGLRYDYVEGTDSSPVGYLEGIFVVEEYRKRGLAKDMLEACQKWAKQQGCKEFASDCELDNKVSLEFHLKMGFDEANRIICFTKKL